MYLPSTRNINLFAQGSVHRMDRTQRLAVGAILLLVAVYGAAVLKLSVNAPVMDDFLQFLGFEYFFHSAESPLEQARLLVAQPEWDGGPQSDHRIGVARIASFISAALTGEVNFQVLTVIGNLFLLGILYLLWRSSTVANPLTILPIAVLLFSFAHYEATFWSSASLLYFPVTFFALLSFRLSARTEGVTRLSACSGSSALATLSQANGLLVLPTLVVAFGLQRRFRLAATFLFLSGLTFALYFWGFSRPAVIPQFAGPFDAVYAVARAWLSLLGGVFGSFSIVAGLVLLGVWTGLFLRRYWERNLVLFALGAWLIGSMATVALGRATVAPEHIVASRYLFYSQLLLAVTYLALIDLYATRQPIRRALGLGALMFSIVYYIAAIPEAQRHVATQRIDAVHDAVVYRLGGHSPYPSAGFPRADLADLLIGFGERTGRFAYPDDLGAPSQPFDVSGLQPKQKKQLAFDFQRLRVRDGIAALRGYAELNDTDCRKSETLLFVAQEGTKWYFDAVRYRTLAGEFGSCRFFAGVLDLRGLPPGRYQIGAAMAYKSRDLYEKLSSHFITVAPRATQQ